MKNIIKPKWLFEHIRDENLIIVDCRSSLISNEEGRRSYLEGHLPAAYFIDAQKQLSGPIEKHGGRHPLPDMESFKGVLESMGITKNKIVVAYDDNKLFNASRFWWQLKYIGHEKVYILEGGMDKWGESGYPISKEIPENKIGEIILDIQNDMLITANEVSKELSREDFIILDARSPERYRGEVEPIDKIAGHIPTAKLYPADENLKENGEWKEYKQQLKRFSDVMKFKDVAVYCGSGINACMNYIALDEIGIQPKLYLGSWSDWITYKENPIAKGEE